MTKLNPDESPSLFKRTAESEPARSWQTMLFGRPLATADASHQTIGKLVGLAVFASDALSSTAYATQEILGVLVVIGSAAFGYVFPISIAIVVLLAIVTISYEQTIHAYPSGGGAYIVSRDNLGERPAQIAAAALLTDYILTVAVSISSGVAQLVSAFPDLYPFRAWIAVLLVAFVALINMRGVKESGSAFAVPTYFFAAMMFLTVGTAMFRYLAGTLGTVIDPPALEFEGALVALTPFLLLHAFSNGTTALTGVEAISNGITAFKEPRSRNAGITLIWMSLILGSLFLSISFLTGHIEAHFSELETVISQLARTAFGGRNFLYIMVISATTVILVMAANTAFAGFPLLSAMVAGDGFLPRQLNFRGSRLVYSRGIVTLAIIASILILIFQASVTRLIPLYAIGVFTSFTLSQFGMARRWRKIGRLSPDESIQERGSTLRYDPKWKIKMVANGFGCIMTFIVTMVFAFTKFSEGAWIVLIIAPALVAMFFGINRHYRGLASKLSLENYGAPPRMSRHRVILLISGVHRGSLAALRYARALSDDVTAVHICIEPDEAVKIQKKWDSWGEGVRLVILDSPYRLMLEPLLEYIEEIAEKRSSNETITVVVPQFVSSSPTHSWLHMNTAEVLRRALMLKPGIVITDVPYQVE